MMVPRHDLECSVRAENRSGQSQLVRSEPGFHLFRCASPGTVPAAPRLNRALSASSAGR